MIRGELYMGSGAELSGEHLNSVRLCREYNAIDPADKGKRSEILKKLCPAQGDNVHIEGPFSATTDITSASGTTSTSIITAQYST